MEILFIFLVVVLPFLSAESRYDQLLEQKGFFTNLGNMWYSTVNIYPRSERTLTFYGTTFTMKSFTDGIINWFVISQTGVSDLFKVIGEYFSAAVPEMIPTVILFGFALLLFIVWGVYQCFVPPFDPKAGYSCFTPCRKPAKYGEISKFSVFARICIVILSAFMLCFIICAFVAAIFINIDIKGVFGGATNAVDFFIDAVDKLNIVNNVSESFLDLTTGTVEAIDGLYNTLKEQTSIIDKYYSASNLMANTLRIADTGYFPGFKNDTPYDGPIIPGGANVATDKTRVCTDLPCLDSNLAFLCPTDPDELVTKQLDEVLQYRDVLNNIDDYKTDANDAITKLNYFIDHPGPENVVKSAYLVKFKINSGVDKYYGEDDVGTFRGDLVSEVQNYIISIQNYTDFKKFTMNSSDTNFICGTYPPFDATTENVGKITLQSTTTCPNFNESAPSTLFCHIKNVREKQAVDVTKSFIANVTDDLDNFGNQSSVTVLDEFVKVISDLDEITFEMDKLFYSTKETLWRAANFLRGLNDFVNDYKALYNSYGNVIFYGTCGLLGVYMLIVLVTVFCIFFCTDDSILCCSQLFHTIMVLIFGAIAVVFSFIAMASMDVWKDLYKEEDISKFHPLFDYLVGLTKPAEDEGEGEGASAFSMSGLLSSPQASDSLSLSGSRNGRQGGVGGGWGGAAVGEAIGRLLLGGDGRRYGLADHVHDLREGLKKRWMRLAANSDTRANEGRRQERRVLGEFVPPTYDEYLPFKDLDGVEIGNYYLRGGDEDKNPINTRFIDKMIEMFRKKLDDIDPDKSKSNYFGDETGAGLKASIKAGTESCEGNMTAFNATVQEIIKPEEVTTMIDGLLSPILKQFSHTITTFWLFAFLDLVLYFPVMVLMMFGRDLWRKRKKRKVRRLKKTAENSVKNAP